MDSREVFEEAYREMMSGNLDRALDLFSKLLKEEPSPEAWVNVGNIFRRMGFMGKAVESYKEALKLRPDMPEAFFNLGCALYQMGKYFEASMMIEKAEKFGLMDEKVKILRALCRLKLHEPDALDGLDEDQKRLVKELMRDG